MSRQLIPRISSEMLRSQPDQTVKIINQIVDELNIMIRERK